MSDQQRRLAEKLTPKHADAVVLRTFPVKAGVVRDHLFTSLRQCGYEAPKIDDATRTVTALRMIPIAPPLSGSKRTLLSLAWEPDEADPGSTLVAWIALDQSPGSRGRPDGKAIEQVGEVLLGVIGVGAAPSTIDLEAPPHNPVLGPGELLDGLFTGNLRDYSGCAGVEEVGDLLEGTLPLGRWAFGQPSGVRYGPPLYLSRYRTGARMEYNGTLLCAPQNSGKTSLIVRWAEAANRAGYNIFLIDVKGNLRRKLDDGRLQGRVYYFSTDPDEETGDRINFLAGITGLTPKDTERIQGLVAALLPREGWVGKGGEDERHYRNSVVWLTALIHILKLREVYYPERFQDEAGNPRAADLNDLYELAADEQVLYSWITELREAEAFLQGQGEALPQCGVDHWVREAIHLFEPHKMPPRFLLTAGSLRALHEEEVPEEILSGLEKLTEEVFATEGVFLEELGKALSAEELEQYAPRLYDLARLPGEGEREPNHGYRDYTQGIVTALEPFSRHGTLFEKIRSDGPGELFALEDLGRGDEQVTIILAAREQDLEKATTILALAVKRLQHLLFERVKYTDEELRPVLLLLDETRRIRTFEADKYITYAREAKAGCVVVYQSLDQVGDEKKIMEILENVGTQIYLGSMVGNTAGYFIRTLSRRYRASVSEHVSYGQEGRSRTLISGKEMVEDLTTNELYRLPAGEWPALVYLNDQPRRKPILVDMYDPAQATPPGAAGDA